MKGNNFRPQVSQALTRLVGKIRAVMHLFTYPTTTGVPTNKPHLRPRFWKKNAIA